MLPRDIRRARLRGEHRGALPTVGCTDHGFCTYNA